ncbi:MAG: hypothetical protein WCZ02_10020, partial [Lysobacterales bacterium]
AAGGLGFLIRELLDAGLLVVFAAGNCGGVCADARCGPDQGPGGDIDAAPGGRMRFAGGNRRSRRRK